MKTVVLALIFFSFFVNEIKLQGCDMKIKILFIFMVLLINQLGLSQWFPQNSGTTAYLSDVSFNDENNGTAVSEGGTILRTTNGGMDTLLNFYDS